MNILEVTPVFSPAHGGVAEVVFRLSRELARRGHRVTVYTSDAALTDDYLKASPGVRVRAFRTRLTVAKFYFTPSLAGEARREVGGFDVVHMHDYRTYQNITVSRYARRYGVPYVLQAHGSLPTTQGRSALKRLFDRAWGGRILRGAARVIAVTAVEARQYREAGVPEDRIRVVPNGIDLAEFATLPARGEFRRKYGLRDGEKLVLFVGRVDPIKGLDLLVRALAGASVPVEGARLAIVGPDAGHLSTLRRMADEPGVVGRVVFTGPLYGRDKLSAYADADLFVLPSRYETFPITVLEAWACGLPVVVTERCGIAGIVDGKAGLVVPPEETALATAVGRLLADDGLRRDFGEEGKRLVREQFNWKTIAGRVEEVYREVAAPGGR